MTTASPLALVSKEEALHRFLGRLASARAHLESSAEPLDLRFTRAEVANVADAFSRSILRGEARLHRLCGLVGELALGPGYGITSVVVGELAGEPERFTLSQPISAETLYATTDLALGNRMLGDIRVLRAGEWVRPSLVANFVEYQPVALSRWQVHKMTSRIKAEEEIWNKVVDELFDIDALVQRDKELSQHSRFIKDVFGVKLVVADADAARRLHDALASTPFSEDALARFSVPDLPGTRAIEFFEVKDYLEGYGKQSGWAALKSVLTWWDAMFELQLQPLDNYYSEREHLTRESHAGFKQRREALRDRIARDVPLFAFMRDLVAWLFGAATEPPSHDGVHVELLP
ncbi:MAG: hypothetical protein H6700_09440 [Myxococcales bacterium]|nr:hypothetical protein [Myxococcales bacterium]MCB9531976.1 hypothetical protein [Myxococcales bacterium]